MGCKSFIILMALFIAPAANAALTINEIMYDPIENDNYNEWIEVYNNGTETLSLENWSLCEKKIIRGYLDKTETIHLNSTSYLNSGEFAVITDGKSGTEAYDNFNIPESAIALHVDSGELCGGLTNANKTIWLKNASGNIIENITYSPAWGAKNNNHTLERNASGWLESTAPGGTPGAQNSVSYSAPAIQNPANENENQNQENKTKNITEEQTEAPGAPQNQEARIPASIEIISAPETLKFGDYSPIRAKFSSGSREFEKARFVAYIYKPSWIARDINANETTLRNSPYNSGAAAEITGVAANETHYLVLPLFLKCNTEGYANAAYTARVRAYLFENSEWKALAESDRDIFVSGESESCKNEIAKETACINRTIEKNCTETTKILRETALEINITHPEIIFAGENFTTKVSIKNSGDALRDIEIYSYIYEHSQIISSGFDGAKWGNARAANSKKVTLYGGNSTTIELISRARENTTAEKYTYKVRFDDLFDDKKSEERIYLIELAARNTPEMQDIKNETLSNSTEIKSRITGNLLAEKTKLQNMSFLDRIVYKIKSWLV